MGKSTFVKRLSEVMQKRDISRGALKDATGISLQSISNYLNDKRKPDCEMVAEIAKALSVSSDYLAGLSNIQTRNETICGIHEKIGLWEPAISALMVDNYVGDHATVDFISYLAVNERTADLVRQIKEKNRFASDPKSVTLDIDGEGYSTDMQAIFKMIVSDLFFEIIEGYTAKPGEIMIDYRVGGNNG